MPRPVMSIGSFAFSRLIRSIEPSGFPVADVTTKYRVCGPTGFVGSSAVTVSRYVLSPPVERG